MSLTVDSCKPFDVRGLKKYTIKVKLTSSTQKDFLTAAVGKVLNFLCKISIFNPCNRCSKASSSNLRPYFQKNRVENDKIVDGLSFGNSFKTSFRITYCLSLVTYNLTQNACDAFLVLLLTN